MLTNASVNFYESQLAANLAQLKVELQINGVSAIDPSLNSVDKFFALKSETQTSILNNISTYIQILAQDVEPSKRPQTNRLHEIARLKSALRTFGLKSMKEEMFELISEDDVIELYNDQGIQLYRNMKFFNLCSYSLLDLAVNSWDALYEKPAWVLKLLLEVQEKLMTTAEGPFPYEIGTFLQREKFLFARTLRTFKVTPKYVCPVLDGRTGRRAGFISTYNAEVLLEGRESLRVDII